MIFNKLIIKSFGKFQNKSIELKDGFNLIYGENEAGKSTVHKFMEGMLYGFYKPNMKNKKLSEEYDRYFPWENSLDYSGVMMVTDDNEVRIERNFMKDNDSLQVFDNITGENITESYEYDAVIKMHEPAKKLVGFNKNTFANTVSITQMSSKTSDELITEIKNNMINLGETNTVDISLDKIQKEIAGKKAEIGSIRSKKSKYYERKSKVEELEEEKIEAVKVWDRIKLLKLEENDITAVLDEKETEKNEIEKKMNRIKNKEFEQKYKDAKRTKKEIEELNIRLEELKRYGNISKEEISDAIESVNKLEVLKKEGEHLKDIINQYNSNINLMRKDIEGIGDTEIEIGTSEKISRDVYKYEEFENSKQYVNNGTDKSKIEEYGAEINKLSKNRKTLGVFSFITIIMTVLLVVLVAYDILKNSLLKDMALINNNSQIFDQVNDFLGQYWYILYAVTAVWLILAIFLLVKKGGFKRKITLLEQKLEKSEKEVEISENRIKDIQEKQQNILKKYNLEDIIDLVAERDKKIQEEVFYQESFKRIEKIENEIDLLDAKIDEKKMELEQKENEANIVSANINAIKEKVDIDSFEEFKMVMDKYYEFKSLESEKINKEELFAQITKGESFEAIYEGFDGEDTGEAVLQINYNELEEQLKVLNSEIVEKNKELTTVVSTISNEENCVRKVVDIVDELNACIIELEKMDNKLAAYKLIEDGIDEIAARTQNNFAPQLNKKVSEIIAVATDYKYTELKVNPNMEISVVDNDTSKLISGTSLSAGTVDLLYFALRIAIADIINEGKVVPIILDDCFVQYDERRLIKVLELLAKQQRQIIMFSCHRRERDLLQKIINDLNVVSL